jgi:hypothetical protein
MDDTYKVDPLGDIPATEVLIKETGKNKHLILIMENMIG